MRGPQFDQMRARPRKPRAPVAAPHQAPPSLVVLGVLRPATLATHNRHFATLWQRVAPSFAALKMAHTQSDIAPSMPQYLRRHVLDCLQTESYDLL